MAHIAPSWLPYRRPLSITLPSPAYPMRVSVVIPCYNSGPLLESAVRSAAQQTRPPLEIICVDDASTNDTRERLGRLEEELHGRLVVLAQPDRRGIGAARNLAVERARGDWIALLDHDDLWLPEKLERQAALAAEHPEAVLLHARCWSQNADDASSRVMMHEAKAMTDADPFPALFLANYIAPCTVLIRKSALMETGGFDPRLDRHGKDDIDLFLRLAERGGRFAHAAEPLAVRRLHEDNFSADALAFHKGRYDVLSDAFDRDRAGPRRLLASEGVLRLLGVLFERLAAGGTPDSGQDSWRALEAGIRRFTGALADGTSAERLVARFPALVPTASAFARRRRPGLHHALEAALAARAALSHAEYLLAARREGREHDTAASALLRHAADAAASAARRAARRRGEHLERHPGSPLISR